MRSAISDVKFTRQEKKNVFLRKLRSCFMSYSPISVMKYLIRATIVTLLLTTVCSKSLRHVRSIDHDNRSSLNESAICSCNWRLLRHYEAKLCQPVNEDDCGCPTKFSCPSANEIENAEKACTYKGKVYEVGSKINTTNVCQICKCLGRKKPRIFCIPIECPQLEHADGENCHPIYEKDGCCPVRYECDLLRTELELKEDKFTCEFRGVNYPLGAKMYPDDNPCEICECTETWNTSDHHQNCYQQDCVLEKSKAQLNAGCVPIYHESRCCPIEFYCPQNEDYSNSLLAFNSGSDLEYSSTGSQCIFGSRFYEIGEELPINHTTKCVTCTCEIPPDFTCIHQSCPEPPHPSENCIPYYSPDECCPPYECPLNDFSPVHDVLDTESEFDKREINEELNGENPCSDIKCDEGGVCMLYLVMCGPVVCPPVPTCLKVNNECQTPICGEGCVVVDQDENNCLTCACGEEIERNVSTIKCQKPDCVGQNCHLVGRNGGCPTCACDEPCVVEECRPGCNVLLSEGEGRCPQCICEDETEGCPTPVCEDETCRIETPAGGCPTCICDRRASDQSLPSQVQHQQSQLDESAESEGHNVRENEDEFDDIQIMSGTAKTKDNQHDNELPNSEGETEHGIRSFSRPQTGGRQP